MAVCGSLSGKVALITGASSGIGAATAVLFARLGARLSLTGRNEANLKKVVEDCTKESTAQTSPFFVLGDVTNEKDVKKMIDSTVEKFGQLDILVNNAGIIEYGTIETTTLESYDRIMNANFTGVLAYCVSKSAIDQLTSCSALELAAKGVRVNSVNPGVIVTDLQKRGGLTEKAYAEFLEKSKETHPLGRAGEPDEVARTIAFLASDASSFITGAHLPVDGGRHAACPR